MAEQSNYLAPLPPTMNLQQAAASVGVSVSTVRNWIKSGQLPAYRLGPRLLRVKPSDLKVLMHSAYGNTESFD
jgi:excisionase family DNA binding protein